MGPSPTHVRRGILIPHRTFVWSHIQTHARWGILFLHCTFVWALSQNCAMGSLNSPSQLVVVCEFPIARCCLRRRDWREMEVDQCDGEFENLIALCVGPSPKNVRWGIFIPHHTVVWAPLQHMHDGEFDFPIACMCWPSPQIVRWGS